MDPIDTTIHYIHNLAKIYPLLLPVSTYFYSMLAGKSIGLALTFIAIVSDLLNVFVFKKVSSLLYRHFYPNGLNGCTSQLLRPLGNHPEKNNCNIFNDCLSDNTLSEFFCNNGKQMVPVKIGMPSGHAQVTTTMTLLFILMILSSANNISIASSATSIIILVSMAAWVLYSRTLIKCHTVNQVMAGSLIGYLLGILAYYILKYYYPDELVEVSWELYLPLIAYAIVIVFINLG